MAMIYLLTVGWREMQRGSMRWELRMEWHEVQKRRQTYEILSETS